MTENVCDLTTVKKTSAITSHQVLAWARRVKAQRAQKLFIEATKINRIFIPWKGMNKKTIHLRE